MQFIAWWQILPVSDNAVFHRAHQDQDIPLDLGLLTHIGVLLSHAYDDNLVSRVLVNEGKHSSTGMFIRKVSFAHARVIVSDVHSDFFH